MTKNELDDVQNQLLALLKEEVTAITYDTWIKNIELVDISDDVIILRAISDYHLNNLNGRYKDLIINTFKFIFHKEYELSIILPEEMMEESEDSDSSAITPVFSPKTSSLNPKYTFESFVVGNNNSFAHAAALATVEATKYNPLFLYGGVGLGKTHLMHAIGNAILKKNPDTKVLYVTSEKFTNELINCIKDFKMEQFRAKYRSIDLLLIDDIQFIVGKERVQEEFFHTFNTLHDNGKQLIISSDKPPKDINPLEERIRSRFEWGILADVSKPDYETRVAILRKKADLDHIIINDEILTNIAVKVESNIRELEGVLNKILAHASLQPGPITIEMAEKSINDIISAREKIISSESIQEIVCKYFNVKLEDIKSSSRSSNLVYPRQIAMYLCKEVAHLSLKQIGKDFGGRDHTTVIHACKKIEVDMQKGSDTKLVVESVKNMLLNKDKE